MLTLTSAGVRTLTASYGGSANFAGSVDSQSHTAHWDFPPIGSAPVLHLQAAAFDLVPPDPWPLPTSNVETVLRQ